MDRRRRRDPSSRAELKERLKKRKERLQKRPAYTASGNTTKTDIRQIVTNDDAEKIGNQIEDTRF